MQPDVVGPDLLILVVSVVMAVVIGFTIAFITNDTAFMSDEDVDKLLGEESDIDEDEDDDTDEDLSEITDTIEEDDKHETIQ